MGPVAQRQYIPAVVAAGLASMCKPLLCPELSPLLSVLEAPVEHRQEELAQRERKAAPAALGQSLLLAAKGAVAATSLNTLQEVLVTALRTGLFVM